MLSAEHRAIVKSTVPLLQSGGEALTTRFYQILLAQHPEVSPFFNRANQVSGDQPRALANSVLLYARNIDRLEALGGMVSQIINKHVSLQVRAEHYPVVGSCLLGAISEVLGAEIATKAVLDAWGAAYGQLVEILSGAEEKMYAATASAPGGWRGSRPFFVTQRVDESAEITSFYLAPCDGQSVISFFAGQYIGVNLTVDAQELRRNYSLSAASNGQNYRISVKRQPGGIASNFLHDHVQVGGVLALFPPAGDFFLTHSTKPLVLISGGVGITPTLAMLEAALPTPRPVHFIHFARNRQAHAFNHAVSCLQKQHTHLKYFYVYDAAEPNQNQNQNQNQPEGPHATGRLDSAQLARFMPSSPDADVYFLGPKMFMRQLKRQLTELGVPQNQARYEFFGPASEMD